MSTLTDYIVEKAVEVLSIDSPSGFTARAADFVMNEYRKLGYEPVLTNKGGILVCVNEGSGQTSGKPEEGPHPAPGPHGHRAAWSAPSAAMVGCPAALWGA